MGTQGTDLRYTYTRVYIVKSTVGLSEKQAINAFVIDDEDNGIPKINSSLVDDTSAGCMSLSGKPQDDVNKLWFVTAQFKTRQGEGSYDPDDENDVNDPTTDRPIVSFGSAQYTIVVEKAYQVGDKQGSPTTTVLNSAGEKFDPPLQSEFSRTIIEVAYKTRTFDPDWMREYENTINKTAIVVGGAQIPAWQGRIIFLNSDPLYDANDELYYAVSIQIELNFEQYITSVLDQGFNYLDEGVKRPILLIKKDPDTGIETKVIANDPQNLDGEGGQSETPVFLDYNVYFTKEWKALDLPREY
jgi:hypothetical protein